VDIEDGETAHREYLPNPGHAPGLLPAYLAERGVHCIVAGGMGPRAQALFDEKQIQTIVGIAGTVDDAVAALERGDLRAGETMCEH